MKATARLHELGQSLWLDNITRTMLGDGTLKGYIDELSVTGLTSNPTIFDKAISGGDAYDEQIAEVSAAAEAGRGRRRQLRRARLLRARRRRPARRDRPLRRRARAHRRRRRLLLARGLAAAGRRRRRRRSSRRRRCTPRPSARTSSSRSPAPRPACKAIEESIFAGIPINVTLLFDDRQYLGAAEAYMRGIERRIEAGLDPDVASVASIFMSRWDVAVADEVSGRAAQPARHRGRRPRLRRLPRAARLRPHAAADERGRPARSGCSGPAPGPRTRTPPTRSTSRPSPRPSRSTRCRSRPCSPSPTTARSAT